MYAQNHLEELNTKTLIVLSWKRSLVSLVGNVLTIHVFRSLHFASTRHVATCLADMSTRRPICQQPTYNSLLTFFNAGSPASKMMDEGELESSPRKGEWIKVPLTDSIQFPRERAISLIILSSTIQSPPSLRERMNPTTLGRYPLFLPQSVMLRWVG